MSPILIVARLVLPLLIIRYPLIGGVIAVALDNLDWWTRDLFGITPFGEYQLVDKWLDLYYFTLLAVYARKFQNKLVRNTLMVLFVYRIIGIVVFEVLQMRELLIFFPNIFENLFFFYLVLIRVSKYEPKLSVKLFSVFFVLVTIPKLMHEYALHVIQRQLIIPIGPLQYAYEHTWHQAFYILALAALAGWYYRVHKSPS